VPRVSSFELPISASHIHLLRVLPVVGCRSKTPTSSSGEEEEKESDWGQASPERWNPSPPSPRATEAAEEQAPGARGRGGTRRRGAVVRRGSVWESRSGDDGRLSSICRTLEEEEARLLHLEVSSPSPRRSGFEGLELSVLSLCS
jgi:hypothetical protein